MSHKQTFLPFNNFSRKKLCGGYFWSHANKAPCVFYPISFRQKKILFFNWKVSLTVKLSIFKQWNKKTIKVSSYIIEDLKNIDLVRKSYQKFEIVFLIIQLNNFFDLKFRQNLQLFQNNSEVIPELRQFCLK